MAFSLIDSWQSVSPSDADDVRAFWQREQANVEGARADERVRQVLTRVLDGDRRLVAVSTAEPRTLPRLRQPMYYYRCFVGAAARGAGIAADLLQHDFDQLEGWARARDFPCIGVLLELENRALAEHLQMACWSRIGFAYIGPSARGLDLRVRYFQGARLKSPR